MKEIDRDMKELGYKIYYFFINAYKMVMLDESRTDKKERWNRFYKYNQLIWVP